MNKDYMFAQEEIKALKLFFILFYVTFLGNDIIYYSFIVPEPQLDKYVFPDEGLGVWFYIWMALVAFICISLMKTRYLRAIKYILFIAFIFLDFINNMLMYYGTTKVFLAGNLVEVFFIFFSPFFVNKRYFWIVTTGIIGKYALVGVILQTTTVMVAITLCFIFGVVCWLLLIRFQSYIETIEQVHIKMKAEEKLVALGRLATAIGHEIRNPLTALKGFTKLQAEKYPRDHTYYDIMTQEIERMNEIVGELMLFGKPKSKEYEMNDIEEIILYVIQVVEQSASKQGITIQTDFQESLSKINCDEKQMKQVFLNLIKNAIEAMPNGGNIFVQAVVNKDEIHIRITDTGCGIPEGKIPKLKEAFYTTKEHGTGLGLMITSKFIEEHEGKLHFESSLGVGTTVALTLPVYNKKKFS
ncbi:histidine kinase [Bacillus manliponensis]|uniref:histidine kinase n=1 Tax=Bacillus manliponensis TaxID=574376 RepID=A0A073JYK0_9BACI|nr:ATP-binding protein [Bacillus manliponensis]KEK19287.1 histidine kinase [Bacillus manliponensis]